MPFPNLSSELAWTPYAKPLFHAIGSLRQGAHQIERAVIQADAVSEPLRREIKLEQAMRDVAALRADLDEAELALAQALEATKRQPQAA